MTYPNHTYPPQTPPPAYPQPHQQPYAPPAQGYPAPQYPAQQPGFPPAYAQQPQGYAQPGFGQPQQEVYQGPPPAAGSLDAFYEQPSVGWGPGLAWKNQPVGTTYTFQVARPVTNADIEQQTEFNSPRPAFYRDGRAKFVMKVPGFIQPSQTFPDGRCQWYVAGAERDELARAMSAAGAPEGPPEEGAVIKVTLTGHRGNSFGTQSAIKQVQYRRPDDYTAQDAPAQPPVAPAPQAPAQPQYQQPAPPQPYAPMSQQQQPAQPQYQAPAVPQGQPLPPLQPANQQLLQQLTGQPAA